MTDVRVVDEKASRGEVEWWERRESRQRSLIVSSRWGEGGNKDGQQQMMDMSARARNMGCHSNMRRSSRRARNLGDWKGRSGHTVRHKTM